MEIIRIEGRCEVALTLTDLQTGGVERTASNRTGCSESRLNASLDALVSEVLPKLVMEIPPPPPPPPPSLKRFGPIPEETVSRMEKKPCRSVRDIAAHTVFWTGSVLLVMGAVSGVFADEAVANQDRQRFEGQMITGFAAGGLLVLTGIGLWVF
jgi:hypothetical protein